jgi:hypothetical protein
VADVAGGVPAPPERMTGTTLIGRRACALP